MSNGYGSYRVVSQAEIERQRLAAAEARYGRACSAADDVAAAIAAAHEAFGDLGVAVPTITRPRGGEPGAVEQAAAAVEEAAEQARRGYE